MGEPAGHCSQFTVVYDACVLYPAPLRDLLMWLATTDLFRARWTADIHDEWTRNVLKKQPDLAAKLGRTQELMDQAAPDCLVTGYRDLIPALTLPDPDDRHVLAAAIVARANLIVTFNLRDFPTESLRPYGIEAKHPEEFVACQFDLDASRVLTAVQRHRQSLRNLPKTVDEYLDTLLAQRLPQTVAELRRHVHLI